MCPHLFGLHLIIFDQPLNFVLLSIYSVNFLQFFNVKLMCGALELLNKHASAHFASGSAVALRCWMGSEWQIKAQITIQIEESWIPEMCRGLLGVSHSFI